MPRLKKSFLFVCALIFLAIGTVWGQSVNSVLSELDQNYYYPQKQGLKSVSARVQWEQLDVASGSGKYLRNPDFIFTWQANSNEGLGKFSLAKEQEGDRFRELIRQINPFRELIIPLTLEQKFFNHEGRVQKGDKLLVRLNSKTESGGTYKLLVDPKEWVIRKLRLEQTHSPEDVKGEFRYIKLADKYAITESLSRFEVKGQQYMEVTQYKYKKIAGIWWVHRIDQTLKRGGQVMQNYVFKLSGIKPILSSH